MDTDVIKFITQHLIKLLQRKNRNSLSSKAKVLQVNRFFDESSLFQLLSEQSNFEYPKDHFLDYGISLKNDYYSSDNLSIKIMTDNTVKVIRLPYKEIINYSISKSRIYLPQEKPLEDFVLSDDLISETNNAFDMFCRERNITSNDTSLRIKSLHNVPNGNFTCDLQKAHYYDQIRTNLTIDYLLGNIQEETLRFRDLDENKSLKPFEKSLLANTLGACAVWVMTRPQTLKNRQKKYYYLLPRKKSTSIYNNMLGTIGGVVKAPEDDTFNSETLEEYVTGEIRREFYEETGIDVLIKSGDLLESDIQIIPLAFTRDLIRGGKPQFFFLISTPYLDSTKLRRAFSQSYNGNEEFDDKWWSHLPTFRVSIETYLNFLYALGYIQKRRCLDYIDLDC